MENQLISDAKQVTNEQMEQRGESVLTDDARNIALAMSLASRDSTIAESPEMKELAEMIEKGAKPPTPAPKKTPTFETSTDVNEETETKPTAKSEKSGDPDSIFFSKGAEAEDIGNFDLTSMEGIQSYFKENYGAESIQEGIKLASSSKKAVAEVEALTKQNDEIQDFLVGLPEKIYNAMETHYKGGDWEAELAQANSKVDFTKPVTSIDEVDLVNHYYPGDFSADDFLSKGTDEVLQKAISIAKKSFERDARGVAADKQALTARMNEKAEAVKSSVDRSISQLKKTFPEISDNAVRKIQKSMVTGDYKSIFFNADGTFTPEAAKSIALALYGDQEIRKSARGQARQEANQQVADVISRGSDKPRQTGGSGSNPQPQQEDSSFMKLIGGYLPSNNTYSANQ